MHINFYNVYTMFKKLFPQNNIRDTMKTHNISILGSKSDYLYVYTNAYIIIFSTAPVVNI